MNEWLLKMFVVSVVGSAFALMWPLLVARFRAGPKPKYRGTGDSGSTAVWFLVVLVIAAVLAAVGFGVFLGEKDTRDELKALGLLGYFSAFTYGFSTGALIEEPLKKPA